MADKMSECKAHRHNDKELRVQLGYSCHSMDSLFRFSKMPMLIFHLQNLTQLKNGARLNMDCNKKHHQIQAGNTTLRQVKASKHACGLTARTSETQIEWNSMNKDRYKPVQLIST